MKFVYYSFITGLALFAMSCQSGYQSFSTKADVITNSASLKRIDNNKTSLRRLESITWDSVRHQLKWDVSRGEKEGNKYVPRSNDHYEIDMDKATMTVGNESRGFSKQEAANVRILMDFISKYALESTIWWENGEGQPLDRNGIPAQPDRQPKGGKTGSKNVRIVNMPLAPAH